MPPAESDINDLVNEINDSILLVSNHEDKGNCSTIFEENTEK